MHSLFLICNNVLLLIKANKKPNPYWLGFNKAKQILNCLQRSNLYGKIYVFVTTEIFKAIYSQF